MYLLLQFTCRYVHNVGRFFWVEQSYHCLDPRLHYWAFLRSCKTFSCCIRATEILPTQADHVGLLLSEQQCYLLSFTVSWFLLCLEGKRMCKEQLKHRAPYEPQLGSGLEQEVRNPVFAKILCWQNLHRFLIDFCLNITCGVRLQLYRGTYRVINLALCDSTRREE